MGEKADRVSMEMNGLQDAYFETNLSNLRDLLSAKAGKLAEHAAHFFLPKDGDESDLKYVVENGHVTSIQVEEVDEKTGNTQSKWNTNCHDHVKYLKRGNIVPEHVIDALDKLRKYGNKRHTLN